MGNKTPLARVLFGRCQKLVGLLVLGVFLFIAVLTGVKPQTANAAAPTNLNFQARLQTSAGSIVPDGSYNIEFKLYNASSSTGSSQGSCSGDANCLWTETRTGANTVTVKNGYLTVNLGSVNAFSGIDWSQQLWLTMRVGGTGTPSWDPEMSPRILLTATPYAMYAANAATLGGIGSSGFIQNTTTPQSANAYITAATSGSVAATLQANAAGTGSILSMRDGSGNLVANFDAFGNLFSQQIASNDTITANTYGTSHNALLVTQSSASATVPVLLVKGGATPGSGSDLLQLQNSSSQALAGFSNAGQLYLGRSSGATGSLKLFNSTNANTVTLQSGVTTGSYTLTLPTALGASGNCLVDTNGSGALGFASCASSGGVTAVGAIAGTSNANGATITGSTLNLTPADGTNGGVVTNTTQTFAGDKTFNGNVGIGGAPSSTKLDITAGTTRGLRITSTNETPYAIAINNATYGTGDGNAFAFYQGNNGVGHVGVGANYQALNIASNGNVGFGAGAANPSRQLVSAISDTQTAAPGTLFQQSGTGDSSIELKNANTSWYTGIDTSNGNSFNINSYGAAAASTTATLGQDYSVQSPTGSDLNPTSIQATKFVAGASGTLSSISMAFRAAVNGSSQYAVGIFADSSGSPGAILGQHTGASVISTPVVGGVNWNTQTLDSPVTITSGTTYWLAVETNDGSSFNTRGAGSGNSAYRTAGVTAGTWGSTFSTTGTGSTSTSTEQIGIYGTITVPGTLSDTYANSVLNITTSGAATFRNSANSTTAFRIQNAASNNILAVDTTGGTVTLGTASSLNASLVFANSSNANSVTLQSGVTSASYSITLPTAAGTTGQCLAAGTVSGGNVPLTFSACGSSGGVTSVGAISSTSNANGATVTGSVLNLTAADQTNGGALTSGNQNIGGTKTFYGGAVINGGQNFSLSAGTGTLTQTYNGTAAGTAQTITMANTSGTNTSAQQIDRNGAGGTTTNGLYVTSTAGTLTNGINIANVSGTLTNGITLSGTMTNLINATNFTVTNAGAITAGSTYNTNTFTGTQLTFGGASGTVTGTNLSLKAAGTGTLTLDSASAGGTVTVGSLATTVNLGLSAGSTINLGTATSGSNTINVANSATATNALSIGSSNTASTTTITGAGNNIVLSNIAGVAISGATSITGSLGVSGSISTGGTQRISNTGALTNVTADTSILTSGTLGIARGGTNNTTYTTNGVIYYDGTKMTSTAAGTSGQCLKSNGTSAAPTYGACGTGSASTLQNAYDASVTASANPMIQLSTAGISVRDAASTVGSLMTFQNSAGTITYFGLTNSALNLQDTSGNASITLDSANHQLKIYENGGTYSRYANVYYDSTNGEAVFTASSGNTRVGSGNGNISMLLGTSGTSTNVNDILSFSKVSTLSAAYSLNDFTISRNLVSGANSETGSVLKVESVGTTSGTSSPNLLLINQATTGTVGGNLINAQRSGSSVFTVNTAGTVNIAAGQAYGGLGAVSLTSAAATNVTITAGTTGSTIVKDATDTTSMFQIQDSAAYSEFTVDTVNDRIQLGTGTGVGVDTVATLLALDGSSSSSDPSGVNGAMYYNTSMAKFRCQENGVWKNCMNGVAHQVETYRGTEAALSASASTGTIFVVPIYIPGQITINEMRVRVTTALGASGDIGLYDNGGNLVLNGGSGSLSIGAGLKVITPTQSNKTLEAGQYYAAVTWNSTTGVVAGTALSTSGDIKRVGTLSGGGSALPSTITPSGIGTGTQMVYMSFNN